MVSLKKTLIQILNYYINYCPYQVGDILISANLSSATACANKFPGTTWTAFSAGRTLVSINSSDTDFNTIGKTGGKKTRDLRACIGICNDNGYNAGYIADSTTTYQSSHSATYVAKTFNVMSFSKWNASTLVGDAAETGSSTSVTNLMPYIVVYMWKRTA